MTPDEFARLFDVSRETIGRLETYADLLKQWQRTINLVAPKTLDDVWHRHFADSAQLYRLIPEHARELVDLGSGAGFPGLVLAIIGAERSSSSDRSDALRVRLVESDTRKAAFLRDVTRRTGIAVDIMSTRIESITNSASLASVDVITSRALAPLPRLLELSEPLFASDTVGLFLKGKAVNDEIDAAQRTWSFDLALKESVTDADARIAVISHLKRK